MSADEVMSILAHRQPFLLVAEIVRLEPGQRASAMSHVPIDDLLVFGNFEQMGVPLWYLAEFLAQTGALAVLGGSEREEITMLTGFDSFSTYEVASVREPLYAEVTLLGERRGIGKRQGAIWQGDRKIAEGRLGYARVRV